MFIYICIFNFLLNSWHCIFAQNGFTIFCSRNKWKNITLITLFQPGTDCGWAESLSLSLVYIYSWDDPLLSFSERPGYLPGSLVLRRPWIPILCLQFSETAKNTALHSSDVLWSLWTSSLPSLEFGQGLTKERHQCWAGCRDHLFLWNLGLSHPTFLCWPHFFQLSSFYSKGNCQPLAYGPVSRVCHPLFPRIRKPEERSGLQPTTSFSLLFFSLASSSADSLPALMQRDDSFDIQID